MQLQPSGQDPLAMALRLDKSKAMVVIDSLILTAWRGLNPSMFMTPLKKSCHYLAIRIHIGQCYMKISLIFEFDIEKITFSV